MQTRRYSKIAGGVCLLLLLMFSFAMQDCNVQAAKSKKISLGKSYSGKTKKQYTKTYTFTLGQKAEIQLSLKMNGAAKNAKDKILLTLSSASGARLLNNQTVWPKQQYKNTFLLEKGTYSVSVYSTTKGHKYKLKCSDVTKTPTKMELQKKAKIKAGYSLQLSYRVLAPQAFYVPLTKVRWASSNPKVATVDASGRVKAVKKGKAKITLTLVNKKVYTCAVTVTKKSLDDSILQDTVTVAVKDFTSSGRKSNVNLYFVNRMKKKALKKITFSMYQYDKDKKRMDTGDNIYSVNYLTRKVPKNSYVAYNYAINPNTKYIRVCVKTVTMSGGKRWKSKYYSKWKKNYKKKYEK